MWLNATTFNVWGHWTADKAAKLVLYYELSNGRTGSMDVNPSMVTGTYDLSKGGTYPITISFLGKDLTATIEVTSYTVPTVFPKTLAGYESPVLMLETKLPNGTASTVEATQYMTGTVDFKVPGKYPVTIKLDGIEAESFDIIVEEMMVYFEDYNYDNTEAADMAALLEKLGYTLPTMP